LVTAPLVVAAAGADPSAAAVLALAAFATATLSAVAGMAGGMTLLAVMLLFLEPLVALPLHGAVQLVSNASRAGFQRRHVAWGVVGRFALLLLPAGFAGLAVARALPPSALRAGIGLFVLAATWLPRRPPERPRRPGRWRFVGLGGAAGFLGVIVGATGPLLGPFFLDLGLSRFAVVGTLAACQTAGHAAKLAVFGLGGFAFGAWLPLLALLAGCTVAGTALGTRLLGRLPERAFGVLLRTALTAVAGALILREAWAIGG